MGYTGREGDIRRCQELHGVIHGAMRHMRGHRLKGKNMEATIQCSECSFAVLRQPHIS